MHTMKQKHSGAKLPISVSHAAGSPSPSSPGSPSGNSPSPDDVSTELVQGPQCASRFAYREDGVLLLSLEDAADRDLKGRETQVFLILTGEEAVNARAIIDEGLASAAAHAIARLPRLPKP